MNGSVGRTLGNDINSAKITLTNDNDGSTITIDFTDTSIDGYKPYLYQQYYKHEMMYVKG